MSALAETLTRTQQSGSRSKAGAARALCAQIRPRRQAAMVTTSVRPASARLRMPATLALDADHTKGLLSALRHARHKQSKRRHRLRKRSTRAAHRDDVPAPQHTRVRSKQPRPAAVQCAAGCAPPYAPLRAPQTSTQSAPSHGRGSASGSASASARPRARVATGSARARARASGARRAAAMLMPLARRRRGRPRQCRP